MPVAAAPRGHGAAYPALASLQRRLCDWREGGGSVRGCRSFVDLLVLHRCAAAGGPCNPVGTTRHLLACPPPSCVRAPLLTRPAPGDDRLHEVQLASISPDRKREAHRVEHGECLNQKDVGSCGDVSVEVMYTSGVERAARTVVMMWANDQLGLARHSMACSHVKVLTTKPAQGITRGVQ